MEAIETTIPKAVKRFKYVAWLEGISYLLLLFVAMPLKYLADAPLMNKIVGMAHGILVVLFIMAVIDLRFSIKWPLRKMVVAVLLSLVPFGTFYLTEKWALKK